MTLEQIADQKAQEILNGCPVCLDHYVRVWLGQRISAHLKSGIRDGQDLDWLEKQGWPLPAFMDEIFFAAETIRGGIAAARKVRP